jgi:hypothetical protein
MAQQTQQRNSPNRPCYCSALRIQLVIIISIISLWKQHINGFVVVRPISSSSSSSSSSSKRHEKKQEQLEYRNDNRAEPLLVSHKIFSFTRFAVADDNYSNDDDDDDDDDGDDGEYIDSDSLGDWRNFRRSLSTTIETDDDDNLIDNVDYRDESSKKKNEEALKKQDKELAKEYASGAWAHVTSTVRYNYYLSFFFTSTVPLLYPPRCFPSPHCLYLSLVCMDCFIVIVFNFLSSQKIAGSGWTCCSDATGGRIVSQLQSFDYGFTITSNIR